MNDLEKATVNKIIRFSGRLSQERIMEWVIPEKVQTGGGGGGWQYTFLKSPPGNFRFFALPQEILEKKAFTPGNSENLRDTPWKSQSQKPRPIVILH